MEAVNTTSIVVGARPAWDVWPRWVLYSGMGFLASAALGTAVALFVPGGMLWTPVVLAIGGIIIGYLQWLVLRRYIPGIRRLGWLLATVLGQFVGSVLVLVAVVGPVIFGALEDLPDTADASLTQSAIKFVGGALLGTTLGLAQWLVLRRYVAKAGWWVPAAALAGAVSALIPPLQGLGPGFGGAAAVILSKAATGAVAAAVTGVALAWILRRPSRTVSSGPALVSGPESL